MIPTWLRPPRLVPRSGARLPRGFQPRLEGLEERIVPSIAYASTVLANNAVLYWRLGDNLSPTAADASGNNNLGSYSGLVLQQQAGAIPGDPNTAVYLEGPNSGQVLGPNLTSYFIGNPNPESVTLSIWFNSLSGGGVLVNEHDINGGWQDTQMEVQTNGEVRVRVWPFGAPGVSLGIASFNAWHHAVLRYDKATQVLDGFLDGVQSATSLTGDRQAPFEFGSGQFYHLGRGGGQALGNGAFFNGQPG